MAEPPYMRKDRERREKLLAACGRVEEWLRQEGADEWTGDDAALAADLRSLIEVARDA